MCRRKKFGGGIEVTIPDTLLSVPKKENYVIYAYVYRTSGDVGETTEKIALEVKARPSRQGQAAPSDPDLFGAAIEATNANAARAEYAQAIASQEAYEIKADREQITRNKQDIETLLEKIDPYVLPIENYFVRESDTDISLRKMLSGGVEYVYILKSGTASTRYTGVYAKIPEDQLSGIWKIETRNANEKMTAPLNSVYLLNGLVDWGNIADAAAVGIDELRNGVDLIKIRDKILSENPSYFSNGEYYLTILNYNKSYFSEGFEMTFRLVKEGPVANSTKSPLFLTSCNAGVVDLLSEAHLHQFLTTKNAYADIAFKKGEYKLSLTLNPAEWSYTAHTIELSSVLDPGDFDIECFFGNDFNGHISHVVLCGQFSGWGPATYTLDVANRYQKTENGRIVRLTTADLGNSVNLSNVLNDGGSVYLCIGIEKRNLESDLELSGTISAFLRSSKAKVVATELVGFNPDDYSTTEEVEAMISETVPGSEKYIICWGDSLTAGGGWTSKLSELSGLPVYNGGTGGENSATIIARAGGDVMLINNLTIPGTGEEVMVADYNSGVGGICTGEGKNVTPLLQGSSHFNPCYVNGIACTMRYDGEGYPTLTGEWKIKRNETGDAIVIDRPTAIVTNYDKLYHKPYLMILFIGQNGGYDNNLDTLVRQHRLVMDHVHAQNTIILGLSSGTKEQRADYETRMKNEFGRYFICLREYLSTPIYDSDGETIISCYGLSDQNLEVDPEFTYGGKTTLEEITEGTVPHQILRDAVHYTAGTQTVIGELIYKKCCELGIF